MEICGQRLKTRNGCESSPLSSGPTGRLPDPMAPRFSLGCIDPRCNLVCRNSAFELRVPSRKISAEKPVTPRFSAATFGTFAAVASSNGLHRTVYQHFPDCGNDPQTGCRNAFRMGVGDADARNDEARL